MSGYAIMGVVTVIYLGVTAFLGYLGFKHTKSQADYLLAGRKTHPVIMAISYGATFISTSAIVGFGGVASQLGMGVLWLTVLNIFFGIFIAFVLFGKRTRSLGHRLDAHTFPDLMGKRYGSRFVQGSAGLLIFAAMPLYAGSVIIGGVRFIKETLPLSDVAALLIFVGIVALYVVLGGLKGVMYTDAFQGGIMFVGMSILLVWTYARFGGVTKAHEALANIANLVPEAWAKGGHRGWTAMPAFGSPLWTNLVMTIVMGVGIGVLAQPQLIVRFMTVKSDRELNRAVAVGGLFILMMTGVAFTVGALANLYFVQTTGQIAVEAAGKNIDNVIPLYINKAMPPWFTAIFLVTLLSAAMSTLSSQFHTMGAALGRDFLIGTLGIKSKNPVRLTKVVMLVGVALSTLIAWFLPVFYKGGTAIIATGTSVFFGLCASTCLPMYLSGLYWKRATKAGALASFFTGLAVTVVWFLFIKQKEAAIFGLCQAVFHKPCLVTGTTLANWDPLIVALPLSFIVNIVVSLFTTPPSVQTVDAWFAAKKAGAAGASGGPGAAATKA